MGPLPKKRGEAHIGSEKERFDLRPKRANLRLERAC